MKKMFVSINNKFLVAIRVFVMFVFVVMIVYVIYFYVSDFIAQTSQTGRYQVRYTISSDNLNSAMITHIDGQGKDVYNISRLPFSVTYTMQNGDKAEIMATGLGNGSLVCFIDVDENLNWRYSHSSGKSPMVHCSGNVGEE